MGWVHHVPIWVFYLGLAPEPLTKQNRRARALRNQQLQGQDAASSSSKEVEAKMRQAAQWSETLFKFNGPELSDSEDVSVIGATSDRNTTSHQLEDIQLQKHHYFLFPSERKICCQLNHDTMLSYRCEFLILLIERAL